MSRSNPHAIIMGGSFTSLDDAFESPLGGGGGSTTASAAAPVSGGSGTGAARARVEAELLQQHERGAGVKDKYEYRLAERVAMLAPRKPRAASFAEEAIGASRIVDAYRGADSEIDRVNAEIRKVAELRAAAEAANCDAPAAHARIVEALHTTAFLHPGVDRMRELVDEYVKVHKDVMLAWNTAQAVTERDLTAELELLLDERELIREVLVAGARELGAGTAVVNAHTCPICFENQSEVAFAPCGHTVCVKCSEKLIVGIKCPTCRRAVTSHIKLFW